MLFISIHAFAQQDEQDKKLPGERSGKETKEFVDDDLIVIGHLGAGYDILNGDILVSDYSVVLKENNVRIGFEDASSISGYPSNDWQIEFNSMASYSNGGTNHFKILDITGVTAPFTVEGNAPDNSLFLSNSSYIGLGTDAPQRALHIVAENTPAIRLDQSGGTSPAQSWDIGGNETSFFIKDVTNSGIIPFSLDANTPNYTFTIQQNGNVGIGIYWGTAAYKLDVNGDAQIDNYFYFGDESTNGNWRICVIDGKLVFEKKENDAWVSKMELE